MNLWTKELLKNEGPNGTDSPSNTLIFEMYMSTGKPTVFRFLDLTTLYLNAVKLVAYFV